MDGLDWIREVDPFNITNGGWIIDNDVNPNNEETDREIQEWIYSQGFKWVYGLTIKEMVSIDCRYYFDDGDFEFDGRSVWNECLDEMVQERGYELIRWSDIKKYGKP